MKARPRGPEPEPLALLYNLLQPPSSHSTPSSVYCISTTPMQSQVHSLASHLLSRLDALASNVDGPSQKRLLVGIVGVPGSGKSELAIKVGEEVERLRKKRRETGKRSDETSVREYDDTEEVTVVIGMDGWHYSRAEVSVKSTPLLCCHRC